MLKYAIYARKSKEDSSGTIKSIKDQVETLTVLAGSQGLSISKVLEENRSAKTPGHRPVYLGMVKQLSKGEIDGVLVWHVNRLARNMEEAGALAQMLIDGRIKEIRTPHWTYRPGDNILPLLLEQGMSAQYSLDLSEAVKRGMGSAAADGFWPHKAKLGYLNARDSLNPKRGTVARDSERFDLTRRGFDLMLTGTVSIREAIDRMNTWGLTSRPAPGQLARPLSYALGYDIFTSPFYAGFTVIKGTMRRGRHEAMISMSEFNRLQAIVKARKRATRDHRHDFAFSGIVRCGLCGQQVTAERHSKNDKNYVYYRCSDTYRRCVKKGISESVVEAAILGKLDSLEVDRTFCDIAIANIDRWQGSAESDTNELVESAEEAIQQVDSQRSKLLDMALQGMLDGEETYKSKDQELLTERSRLAVEVERMRESDAHMRRQLRSSVLFVRDARDEFLMAAPARRREIARSLATYLLRANHVEIGVDPLLTETVKFVQSIRDRFEPIRDTKNSSGRPKLSFSSQSCHDGRAKVTSFELPKPLLELLWKSDFPDLQLVDSG
ncbi:MAG TPA: recombinase family protein [Capsulimonadaceae bacterium]|jgi:DNA invertase Pin-like site-specific DNA recombinase